jgi:prepilin-type processing-associated H-X9-DG protein
MILAAILFPVFAQARESARQKVCMSDEKQMALAVRMYNQDYDERMPPAAKWMDAAGTYTQDERLFHCPNVSRGGSGGYGYAFDSSLNYKPLDKIANPKTERMIFDSTLLTRNASDSGSSLPSPGRHKNGNNLAFADGHVVFTRIKSSEDQPPP